MDGLKRVVQYSMDTLTCNHVTPNLVGIDQNKTLRAFCYGDHVELQFFKAAADSEARTPGVFWQQLESEVVENGCERLGEDGQSLRLY